MSNSPGTDWLVSWFAMEENGGNAYDSHGSGTLIQHGGTIPRGNGKIGYCRNFEKDTTHYFTTGGIGYASNECTTIGMWIKIESIGSTMTLLHNNDLFSLKITSTGYLEASIYYNGVWGTAQYPTKLLPATWYFVTVLLDGISTAPDVDVLLDVNASGTPAGIGVETGIGEYVSGTGDLYIGSNSTPANYFDGKIDELFMYVQYVPWSPTPIGNAEIAWLYNNGDGRSYTELQSGGFMAMF